jgi:surfeit locus 1 family protein
MSARAAPRHPARALIVPAILTLAGTAVLAGLGTWQLERRQWKHALIAKLEQRLSAPPVALPPPQEWRGLGQSAHEFTRVAFRAAFVPGEEALVYSGAGSALRKDVSGPGYWVFAPARTASGAVVVVNRGFVPEGRQDPASRTDGALAGPVDLVGVLRWPEEPSWFTPASDPARNLWFARDQGAIAAARKWGDVAPFYVEQEAPVPPGGLPRPGRLAVSLPDNHLQYALTWYGLALILAVVFAVWVRGRGRATPARSGPGAAR